jgi:AAA domain
MVGSPSLVASTLEHWREEAKGYLADHRPDIPINGMSDGWLDINVQDVARKRGDKSPPRRPASGQRNGSNVTRLHDSPGIDPSGDGDPIPLRTQAASPPVEIDLATVFTLVGDAPASPPRELIKGLLPADGVAVTGGQSSAGKTFIKIYKAICLATGAPYFGRRIVERVGTAFVFAEGRAITPN